MYLLEKLRIRTELPSAPIKAPSGTQPFKMPYTVASLRDVGNYLMIVAVLIVPRYMIE